MTQSQQASTKTAVESFLEEANMAYADLYAENMDNGEFDTKIELDDLVAILISSEKNYKKTIIPVPKSTVGSITLSSTEITLIKGFKESETITVTPNGELGNDYYAQIKGVYYKMELTSSGIILGEALSELPEGFEVGDISVNPESYNGGLIVSASGTSVNLSLANNATTTAAQEIEVTYAGKKATTSVTIKDSIIGCKLLKTEVYGSTESTTINGTTIDEDWYVLYVDDTNDSVWVMYGDYLPTGAMPEGSNGDGITNNGKYNVWSTVGRTNLLDNYLLATSKWSNFADLFKNSSVIPSGTNTDGIVAQGSPTAEMIYSARNKGYALAQRNFLNIHMTGSAKYDWNNAYGYWLASIGSEEGINVAFVYMQGDINYYNYNTNYGSIRPVVSIPKSIFNNFTIAD